MRSTRFEFQVSAERGILKQLCLLDVHVGLVQATFVQHKHLLVLCDFTYICPATHAVHCHTFTQAKRTCQLHSCSTFLEIPSRDRLVFDMRLGYAGGMVLFG